MNRKKPPNKSTVPPRARRGSSPTVSKSSQKKMRSSPARRPPSSRKGPKSKRLAEDFTPTLGDLDLHLFGEGKHLRIYEKLGAHPITHEGRPGVSFAVWAPAADQVSVAGNFNGWDPTSHPMRRLKNSGVWELFVPGLGAGELYKYAIRTGGHEFFKADPYAFMMEVPPDTSSVVFKSNYKFHDRVWMTRRRKRQAWREPLSIYEVHLGSWRRVAEEDNRPMSYREMAPLLASYARQNGFTHVEFLPLKEHPYGPSWGYQVSAYLRSIFPLRHAR